ncbi:hypothetical protein Bca101_021261 [Brassica carinata]
MEASTLLNNTNTIADSTGTGGNYNASDPVVHLSFSEAEKRMKKLERDYQHTYKNYKETRINRSSFYMKGNHSSYRSWQAVYCIGYYQDLREQLQNDLEKLNKAEATQRRTEKHDYINKFSYNQSKIPKSSSSKGVHALLRRFKETVKLRGKVTASGELVENPTTQDSLTISIKILTKAIKKLEKDRERETMIGNGYEEQKRRLDKKSEWIWRKCDEQKKSILELKKIHKDVCSKLHAQFIDDDKRWIWRKIY